MKYKLTTHFKARFSERVNFRDTMAETVALVKKYGVRIQDVIESHEDLRSFLAHNKIYYKNNIYVFDASSNYTKLVTVYDYTSDILESIFMDKELKKKSMSSKAIKPTYSRRLIYFRGWYYWLTRHKNKIIGLKLLYSKPAGAKTKADKFRIVLERYFNGKRVYFRKYIKFKDINPLDEMVYKEVLNIPYGLTISYKQLAKRVNIKISIQALVGCLNRCPILYLIPVHRVIRSDGKIGSFCYNNLIKKELLDLEQKYKKNNDEIEMDEELEENDFCVSIGELIKK